MDYFPKFKPKSSMSSPAAWSLYWRNCSYFLPSLWPKFILLRNEVNLINSKWRFPYWPRQPDWSNWISFWILFRLDQFLTFSMIRYELGYQLEHQFFILSLSLQSRLVLNQSHLVRPNKERLVQLIPSSEGVSGSSLNQCFISIN